MTGRMLAGRTAALTVLVMALGWAHPAEAVVNPFTEDFVNSAADWRDGGGVTPSTWEASGGVGGGGHITENWDFANSAEDDPVVLFRGHDAFDSSGDAFVGDWLAAGVNEFSMWVRHDADVPVQLYARFATSFNFPGAVGVPFELVDPGEWVEITIPITESSPNLIYEGSFGLDDLFTNIGNIQVAMNVPASLAGEDAVVRFDFDQPSITPEPGTLLLLGSGFWMLTRRRRVPGFMSSVAPRDSWYRPAL